MSQRGYIHEIWLCPDEDGELLPTCIHFGPAGNSARELNELGSFCAWLFFANSHFEAMQIIISSPTSVSTQHQSKKTINHTLSLGTLNKTTTCAASNNALKSFASLTGTGEAGPLA